MDLAGLIAAHGYWALALGTFLEGETILVLAGVAAHRGYLDLRLVILVAFAGSLLGDQFFFLMARRHAGWLLRRLDAWRSKVDAVHRHLERHQLLIMLGFRFVYGIRVVTPVVIGLSRVPAWRFAVCNAAGAAVWAVVVGSGGYLLGNAVNVFLENARVAELAAFGLAVALGLGLWLRRRLRRR